MMPRAVARFYIGRLLAEDDTAGAQGTEADGNLRCETGGEKEEEK